jgi:two-component system, chemotaxis family, protein-glutamate methylesterase/glutaminase
MTRVEIVVVGASLGGLTAVRQLIEPLPENFAPAVVLAQHRRADADSRLADLMSAYSPLPVIEPEDREPLRPGHVYLAPANYHLMVDRQTLSLSVDPPVWFARPSIDVLFESAADAFAAAAVAVVLTGANEDGAAGARAIKRARGTVLVQDPDTAESPICPRATIAATPVDDILPVPLLARRLAELVHFRSRF